MTTAIAANRPGLLFVAIIGVRSVGGSSRSLGSGLLGDGLGDGLFQLPAGQVDVADLAVPADEDVGRDLGDAEGAGEVLVARAVGQVRPGDVVVEQEPADV